jgi:hypothetical protein
MNPAEPDSTVKFFPKDVLQLWYDFMVASNRDKWNEDMRENLGPKEDETFDDWERRCREDLIIISNWYLQEHEDPEDFKRWYVPKEDFDLNEIHLTVNLDNPKIEIKKAFAKLIDERQKVPPGRIKDQVARALIQPNGEVRVNALKKTLAVYKAYQENPQARAVDVAVEVFEEKPGAFDADSFRRRSVQAEIARQRAKAAAIMAGVEVGRFPNPNKPPRTA